MIDRGSLAFRQRPSFLARLFRCCGAPVEPASQGEPSSRVPTAPIESEAWLGFVRPLSNGIGRSPSARPGPAAPRFDPAAPGSWANLCVDPSHLQTEVHHYVDAVPDISDAELPLEMIADEGHALFPTDAGREAIARAQPLGTERAPDANEKPPAEHLRVFLEKLEAGGPFKDLKAEDAPAFVRKQKARLQNIWLVLGRNDAPIEARLSILAELSLLDEACAQAVDQYLGPLYSHTCCSEDAVRAWVDASTLENTVLATLATLRTRVLEGLAGRLEATPENERPYRAHTLSVVVGRFGPKFGLPASVVEEARGDHNWGEARFLEASFAARLPALFHGQYDRTAIMGAVRRRFNEESPGRLELRNKLERWIDEHRPPGLERAAAHDVKFWLYDAALENIDDHAIAFVLWKLGVLRAQPHSAIGSSFTSSSRVPSAGIVTARSNT